MPSDVFDRVLASVPMGRAGTPDDVAAVVAFLASDEAAYVTGESSTFEGVCDKGSRGASARRGLGRETNFLTKAALRIR